MSTINTKPTIAAPCAATTKPRASSEVSAWLEIADLTPTGYRVGRYLAARARYATPADGRRKVRSGELFAYPRQATIAAALGCSVRQVERGVRSLKSAGLEVRRRVRPCSATYVFPARPASVASCVGSGVGSQRNTRTESRNTPIQIKATCTSKRYSPPGCELASERQVGMACAIGRRIGVGVNEHEMVKLSRQQASLCLHWLEVRERHFDSPEARLQRINELIQLRTDPAAYEEMMSFGSSYDIGATRSFDAMLAETTAGRGTPAR